MLQEQATESPWIVGLILQFCTAQDVLNVLSTSKSLHTMGTTSPTFWIQLLMALKPQQPTNKTTACLPSSASKTAEIVSLVPSKVASLQPQSGAKRDGTNEKGLNDSTTTGTMHPLLVRSEMIYKAKNEYLLYSSCQLLSSVRWYHTTTNNYYTAGLHNVKHMKKRCQQKKQQPPPPCAREGHLMCRFFHNEDNNINNHNNTHSKQDDATGSECSILVITGGFTDDSNIYIKEIYKHRAVSEPIQSQKKNSSISQGKTRRSITKPMYTSPFDDSDHDFDVLDHLYEVDDADDEGYGWISVVPTVGITRVDEYAELSLHNDDLDNTGFHNLDDFYSIPDSNRHSSHEESASTSQEGNRLHWTYGSTLTSLDSRRAIRYGGFQGGGYSMESSQVAILEVFREKKRSSAATDKTASTSTCGGAKYRYWATWTIQNCTVSDTPISTIVTTTGASSSICSKATIDTRHRMWERIGSRAYHTATMLFDRYLFVIGGMKGGYGSILAPILLDTHTWTWYYDGIVTSAADGIASLSPSARFGHSVVTDYSRFDCTPKRIQDVIDRVGKTECNNKRKIKNNTKTRIQSGRLVLFGGGNGRDLLRSGCDNAEVWELNLHLDRSLSDFFCNDRINISEHFNDNLPSFQRTFPWSWKDITIAHNSNERKFVVDDDNNNDNSTMNEDNDDSDDEEEIFDVTENSIFGQGVKVAATSTRCCTTTGTNHISIPLSPSERLILGRCHAGYKVSDDTVILLLGSGRPCTNGVIGYNLETNDFIRPSIVGPLPAPRFTFASTYVPEDGCIVIHGGYSSKQSNCLQDVLILDVAAAGRPFRIQDRSGSNNNKHKTRNVDKDDIDFINCAVLSSFPINMTNPRQHPAITDEEAFVRQQLQNPHSRNYNNETVVYSADLANFLAGYLRGYYYDDDDDDDNDDNDDDDHDNNSDDDDDEEDNNDDDDDDDDDDDEEEEQVDDDHNDNQEEKVDGDDDEEEQVDDYDDNDAHDDDQEEDVDDNDANDDHDNHDEEVDDDDDNDDHDDQDVEVDDHDDNDYEEANDDDDNNDDDHDDYDDYDDNDDDIDDDGYDDDDYD